MSRRKVLGLAAMVLSSTWLPIPACAAQTNDCSAETPAKFKLLTGQAGLNYNIAGRAIAEVYNKTVPPNEQLVACQSMGSIENVRELSEGKATFAIVQSDVMHSVWFAHQLFVAQDTAKGCMFRAEKKPIVAGKEPLYLIAPLYAENLHILLRPHLNISNLVELKAHRVWVGSPESGSYLTAERVLGAAGLGMCDISTSDDDGHSVDTTLEALGELNAMKLDAVFFTGASGTSVIQQAFNNSKGEIHFLPLDVNLMNQLSADGSYVETMIRKRDYSDVLANAQGTPTVGVQALLIVSPNRENANVVDSFMKFFADNDNQALVRQQIRSLLTSAGGGSKQQTLQKVVPGGFSNLSLLQTATPPAFLDRFCPSDTSQGRTVAAQQLFYVDPASSWYRALLVIGLTLIFLLLVFAWQRKRIGPRVVAKYPVLFCSLIGIVLTWSISSFLLWYLERRVNEDFTSIGNSALHLIDYLTPYFGREALTRTAQTTITIVRAVLTALFLGGLWPSLKPVLRNRLWNPLASWMKGED